jgi:hypothetical protein
MLRISSHMEKLDKLHKRFLRQARSRRYHIWSKQIEKQALLPLPGRAAFQRFSNKDAGIE